MKEQKHISRRAFMGTAATLSALSLVGPTTAFADPTTSDVQAEAAAARETLTAMQRQLDAASNDYNMALEAQQMAQMRMDQAQVQIDSQSVRIAQLQTRLSERARSMYRTGGNTFLDVLLGSSTWEEFATNWDILNSMNEEDSQLVAESKASRAILEDSKASYVDQRNVAQEKAFDAKVIAQQAQETLASQQQVYDNLSAQAAELLAAQRKEEEAAALANVPVAFVGSTSSGSSGSTPVPSPTQDNQESTPAQPQPQPEAPAAAEEPSYTEEPSYEEPSYEEPSYNGGVASTVIAAAESRFGCPYVWGAKGPDTFDCSGLVAWCYAQAGVYVPSYTGGLIGLPQSDGQPGDICVIHDDVNQHTGIYVGGGSMIHAPETGDVVRYGSVQAGMIFVRPNY